MIEYTVGDTLPVLVLALESDGTALPLGDALSATLKVVKPSGATLDVVMEIDDVLSRVSATFAPGDLDESGEYVADVLLVFEGGTRQHALRSFKIRVRPEAGELD